MPFVLTQRGPRQLRGLAYNLGNFLRTLATPEPIKDWSRTSLKGTLISKTLASVRPLLGPNWIIEGEDPERYEKILGRSAPPRSLSTSPTGCWLKISST